MEDGFDKSCRDLFLSIQKVVELVELIIDPPELVLMLMLLDELPMELPWPIWIGTVRAGFVEKGIVGLIALNESCCRRFGGDCILIVVLGRVPIANPDRLAPLADCTS